MNVEQKRAGEVLEKPSDKIYNAHLEGNAPKPRTRPRAPLAASMTRQ
jgi:hypothetical protein